MYVSDATVTSTFATLPAFYPPPEVLRTVGRYNLRRAQIFLVLARNVTTARTIELLDYLAANMANLGQIEELVFMNLAVN